MKSTCMKRTIGLVVCLIAVSALSAPSGAGALETECRAAVRAEMKGPNCRVAEVNSGAYDNCGFPIGTTIHGEYGNRVVECVSKGGPGRKAR